ncbi:MAG: PilN domain-containing protein [Polyangiales bacterium]
MIRVNLLPRRREAKREGSQAWIAVLLVAALLEVIGIVIAHAGKKAELEQQLQKNREVEAGIAQSKAQVAQHEVVKKQIAEYQAREDAITKLQAGRTGPTAMLIELSHILTPRKMPTIDPETLEKLRRENPLSMPSERWDPHHVWLTSFKEQDHVVTINGIGQSDSDVAEFWHRLSLSRYFTDVKMGKSQEQSEHEGTVNYLVHSFDLHAKAKY